MIKNVIFIIKCFTCARESQNDNSIELEGAMTTVEYNIVDSFEIEKYLDGIDIHTDSLDKLTVENDSVEQVNPSNIFDIDVKELFSPVRDKFRGENFNILNKNSIYTALSCSNEQRNDNKSLELWNQSHNKENQEIDLFNLKKQLLKAPDYLECPNMSNFENNVHNETVKTKQEMPIKNNYTENILNPDNTNSTVISTQCPIEYSNSEKKIKLKTKGYYLRSTQTKRKIDYDDLLDFSKSDLSHKISKFPCKKKCLNIRSCGIIENPIINNTETYFYFKEINDHKFLKIFEIFLREIEKEFNDFLQEKLPNKCLSIYQILYCCEFTVVQNFNETIFGNNLKETLDISKRLSSTYDILDSFINKYKFSENVIICLRDCIDKEIETSNIEALAHHIKTLILDFLDSPESKYIISFLPQLKSYVNLTQDIDILYDENVFKGFVVFLFLLKRNHMHIQYFKKKILNTKCLKKIKIFFTKETIHNLVFLNVFFHYWPIKLNKNIILSNILAIIKINCCLLNGRFRRKLSKNVNNILIFEHFFFELKEYEILPDVKNLLNSESIKIVRKQLKGKLKNNSKEISNAIKKLKFKFAKEFKTKILKLLKGDFFIKMKFALENPNSLSEQRFKNLLLFMNRYNIYILKSKGALLYHLFEHLKRKKH